MPFLAFTNTHVIDGVSAQPLRTATVIVREGRIVSVGQTAEIPAGAMVMDLKGRWLLPGLIDAHVHVTDDSAPVALQSGVTTVRTGGAGISARDKHRAGNMAFPEVLASRAQVSRQPAALFFQNFPQLADFKGGIRGPEDIRRMVRGLAENGADVIKIMATERSALPQDDPKRGADFTEEELVAGVAAATQAGRAVMAHATEDEGAGRAVRAGARSIEHGTYLSDATLSLMRAQGTFFVPTVTVLVRYIEMNGPGPEPDVAVAERSRERLPVLRAVAAKAVKMGVRVVAGSDNTYRDRFRFQDELGELVRAGLSPMDAIKAATSLSAECLMIHGRMGAIKPGLEADIIIVEGDPTANIDALRDVVLVVNNGRIAVDRLRRLSQ